MCVGSSSLSSAFVVFIKFEALSDINVICPDLSMQKVNSGWESRISANFCNLKFSTFRSPIRACKSGISKRGDIALTYGAIRGSMIFIKRTFFRALDC